MPGSRRAGKPEKRPPAGRAATEKTAPRAKRRDPREISARARSISRILGATYPDAHCMLDHSNPFELLVATILAAQCTDERVNKVTPALFKRFPTPAAMAAADIDELEG